MKKGDKWTDQQVYWKTILTEVLGNIRETKNSTCVGLLYSVYGVGEEESVCCTSRRNGEWKNNSGLLWVWSNGCRLTVILTHRFLNGCQRCPSHHQEKQWLVPNQEE